MDYPTRYIQSIENGHRDLVKSYDLFKQSGHSWMYWSRDMKVSHGFITDLMTTKQIRFSPTLHDQNTFDEAPGIFRLVYWLKRKDPNFQVANFAVDTLFERNEENVPTLTIVLRSSPIARQSQKVWSLLFEPKLAPARR